MSLNRRRIGICLLYGLTVYRLSGLTVYQLRRVSISGVLRRVARKSAHSLLRLSIALIHRCVALLYLTAKLHYLNRRLICVHKLHLIAG